MPLTPATLALPAAVEHVSVGDVDGDGIDELVIESRVRIANQPDGRKLTFVSVPAAGAPVTLGTVDLGNRPALWDVKGGLWLVDKDGLAQVAPATGALVRIARFSTALAALGPTTPVRATIARDLDGDGKVELLAWSAGRYVAWTTSGGAFGSIPAPARGDLDTGYQAGGDTLAATIRPPPLSVADLDGDGRLDLLLPHGKAVDAYYTGDSIGARAAVLTSPIDLDPPKDAPITAGEVRRDVAGVWLQDMDGDKRADLGVQRNVYSGGWFGATSEWLYAKGSGSGFGAVQTTPIAQASFGMRPLDVDGDGRQELLTALVDVGVGNLARALVSKEVQAQLSLFRLGTTGWDGTAVPVHTLHYPVEHAERFHVELKGDVDGDRRLDLVTDDGGAALSVFRGTGSGFASTADWSTPLTVPPGDDSLLVADLDGDGRAEIVVWGKDQRTATVLRVR